ncbi:uncharacterized protein LOC143226115 isoform X3 [Tachypleus tridentatus]|uniref:uncharacterized protein LOC143226115 isoform X3 n=1 Tax=Tachypleus tridentatus TaxID=6853 RepID=UPI003FD697C2
MCHSTDFLWIPTEEDDGLQLSIGKTGHPQSTPDFVVNILCQHPIKSSFPDEVTGGVLSKVKRKLGLLEVSKMIFS